MSDNSKPCPLYGRVFDCGKCELCNVEELQKENERLKTELEDVRSRTAQIEGGELDFTISGENAKLFYAMVMEIFKQNGGKNFLCQTILLKSGKEKYSITIQDCNKQLTPAEKLNQFEREKKQLQEQVAIMREAIQDFADTANILTGSNESIIAEGSTYWKFKQILSNIPTDYHNPDDMALLQSQEQLIKQYCKDIVGYIAALVKTKEALLLYVGDADEVEKALTAIDEVIKNE